VELTATGPEAVESGGVTAPSGPAPTACPLQWQP
jgi:hypothetical protein